MSPSDSQTPSLPVRRVRRAPRRVAPARHDARFSLHALRARLSTWVAGSVALVGGAAVGLALVVVALALPNAPASVLGLCVGALLGSTVTLALTSRYSIVRRGGGLLILLSPLLVLAAPFLLIAAAVALLRKTSSWSAAPPATLRDPAPDVIAELPRRTRRRHS